jgi:hypothetical protein
MLYQVYFGSNNYLEPKLSHKDLARSNSTSSVPMKTQLKNGSFYVKPTILNSDAFKSLKYYIPAPTRAVKKQSNFSIGSKDNLKDQFRTTTNSSVGNLPEIENNFLNRFPGVEKREQLNELSKGLKLFIK